MRAYERREKSLLPSVSFSTPETPRDNLFTATKTGLAANRKSPGRELEYLKVVPQF